MTHQVDQLKEEITTKEAALVKVHLEHQRIEKEKESLKVRVMMGRRLSSICFEEEDIVSKIGW